MTEKKHPLMVSEAEMKALVDPLTEIFGALSANVFHEHFTLAVVEYQGKPRVAIVALKKPMRETFGEDAQYGDSINAPAAPVAIFLTREDEIGVAELFPDNIPATEIN